VEPLLIYAVLFFPGLNYGEAPSASFSIIRELSRVLGYNIPSLLLIWYLSYLKDRFWRPLLRPSFRDLRSLGIALPSLIAAGFLVSFVSSLAAAVPAAPLPAAPRGFAQWLVIVLSCLSTGYLEETYFRFYLLTRLEGAGIPSGAALVFSVLLFSFCHVYEGPWGTLNAALAGALLSLIFLRRRSLHGIAWAHGLYNVFVYLWL
jgi:membrane protease YdiL (CAAX protease family)